MPTSDVIKIRNARLSFPRLFTPKSFRKGQEARYESTFLLDPSDESHAETIREIEEAADAILEEHYGNKLPRTLVRCFGMTDDLEKTYDGYEDMWMIATATPQAHPPVVVDRGRKALEKNEDTGVEPKIPYAGCYVNTNIPLWVMDK